MYTTQLVKKYKSHGRNKRQRGAAPSRRVPNNRINRFNLVTLRNQINATDFREIFTDPGGARKINPMYKFLTVDVDPPIATDGTPIYQNTVGYLSFETAIANLKWNDGIFWWFGSNYFELPLCTSSSSNSIAPCTSNLLLENRRLCAGNAFVDCEDNTFQLTADLDQVAPIPIIRGEDINHVHQVSQRVKIQEQMVYQLDKKLALDSQSKYYVTQSVNSFVPAWTFDGSGSNGTEYQRVTAAQQFGARDLCKFCVRNVCIQLPAYVQEDDDPDEYTKILRDHTIPAWEKAKAIETALLSEIFVTADYRCGPPTQSQRDLYAKINPKFKILRDYKQTFAPPLTTTTRPSRPKTTDFYHRYNTSKPTQLETSVEQYIAEDTPKARALMSVTPVNGCTTQTGFTGFVPAQDPPNEPIQSLAEQIGDEVMTDRAQVKQTKSVSCYFPKSSRIVWLRFPRFANTWELQDIKDKKITVPPLNDRFVDHALNTSDNQPLAMVLLSAGTRITGYTEWKVMKPEGMGQPGFIGPPLVSFNGQEKAPNEVGETPIRKRARNQT